MKPIKSIILLLATLALLASASPAWSASWSPAGALSTARGYHTATRLPNGKALVAGGYSLSPLSSTELYNPVAKTWSSAGALTTARIYHTATLLENGTVLVAGGQDSNNSILSSAELYDPATARRSSSPARPKSSSKARPRAA